MVGMVYQGKLFSISEQIVLSAIATGSNRAHFLRNYISLSGVSPNASKVAMFAEMPTMNKLKQLRSLLSGFS